jgi:hypothetical protein
MDIPGCWRYDLVTLPNMTCEWMLEDTVMGGNLPVINLTEAKYECIFGRGCDGICCQNGRPGLYEDEVERIEANLVKFLPHLRPNVQALIEKQGFLSSRRRHNLPLVRVNDGWCFFFNQGCVLHKVGAEEGDKYRYKPAACSLFPLAKDEDDRWYVRQAGYKGEKWDLFCLKPETSPIPASESIQEEVQLALRYDAQANEELGQLADHATPVLQ